MQIPTELTCQEAQRPLFEVESCLQASDVLCAEEPISRTSETIQIANVT